MADFAAAKTRLMDNLRIKLPGALDGVIKLELYNVLDEFFRETLAWREDVQFTTVVGDQTYQLTTTDDVQILTLMWVGPADEDGRPTWGRSVAAEMQEPGIIRLAEKPAAIDDYVVVLALTVADPTLADGFPFIPEWTLTRYHGAIIDGVLSRMMSQPAKPYSNSSMAVYHGRRFRNACAVARSEARKNNVFAGQAWRFPKFA